MGMFERYRRRPGGEDPPSDPPPEDVDLHPVFQEFFAAHGIEAELRGRSLFLPGCMRRASAEIVSRSRTGGLEIVQLDFRLEIEPGRVLVESMGGFGETVEDAIRDSIQDFVQSSLHVLMRAFVLPAEDDYVEVERWNVSGIPRTASMGIVTMRGVPPGDSEACVAPFREFEARIKAAEIPPGTHWIRLYYAQVGGRPLECEVLLDNEDWPEVRETMARFPWPESEDFYSMRLFLVLQDEARVGEAILRAAPVFADFVESDPDAIVAALEAEGISPETARDLVDFMPLAFARMFLQTAGPRFADYYVRVDDEGRERERRDLLDEPVFREAVRLAPMVAANDDEHGRTCFSIAVRSPEFQAVNDALHAGSRPEDLVCSPPVFLWSGEG